MLKSKTICAILGIMMLLVSCKEGPPSTSPVVSKHSNKQRIQIASVKLPPKVEKIAQKESIVNSEVKKNIEKVTSEVETNIEENVDKVTREVETNIEENVAKIRSRFEGWRNPFKPFITKVVENNDEESRPKSPLEKYNVNELKLIAIIWGIKRPTAMIEDPDGTGYIVKKGTLVGDKKGKVVKIFKDKVIVKERFRDLLGNSQVEEVALELHNLLAEGRSL